MASQISDSIPRKSQQPILPRCPRESYMFGIVCMRDFERASIIAALDAVHERHQAEVADVNDYIFGRLCQYNVIVASPPSPGSRETPVTISVVDSVLRSFTVRALLLVGVCEAAVAGETGVSVGDVIVSHSKTGHGGMVQLDLDTDGGLQRTDFLFKSPKALLSAVQKLRKRPVESRLIQHLQEMAYRHPEMDLRFEGHQQTHDCTCEGVIPPDPSTSCDNQDSSRALAPSGQVSGATRVHYGTIATGHTSAQGRLVEGYLAEHRDILGFDTKAASLVKTSPCLIIRGSCKLASRAGSECSQRLAAATAACYAKELLGAVQMSSDPAALHQPLDFNRFETRFLEICPRNENQDPNHFEAKLHNESLIEPTEYVALSYCWGDHSSTELITVNGISRLVTTKLKTALLNLRAHGVKMVWVDALSIDQSNHHERIYQLSRIGTIFSKAKRVIAWLGPAADESDRAVHAFLRLDADVRSLRSRSAVTSKEISAIIKLLERPYWRRVWTIQEIAKASAVEIWCGDQVLEWVQFVSGHDRWNADGTSHAQPMDTSIKTLREFCERERVAREGGSARMRLTEALIRTFNTEATLRKDKVYALLGVVCDGYEIVPTPNYMQDDTDLFRSIFKYGIVAQRSVDLIMLGGRNNASGWLPSWLPSWTERQKISPWAVDKLGYSISDSNYMTKLLFAGSIYPHCRGDTLVTSARVFDTQGRGEASLSQPAQEPIATSVSLAITSAQASPAEKKCSLLMIQSLWHVLDRMWPKERLPPAEAKNQAGYILAAFWSLPVSNAQSAGPPELRLWYEHNRRLRVGFGGLRLEHCVEEATRNSHTLRYMSVLRHRDADPESGDLSTVQTVLQIAAKGLNGMTEDKMKIMAFTEKEGCAVVPEETQYGDYIARLPWCPSTVVLRPRGDGKIIVVGEMRTNFDQIARTWPLVTIELV